LRFNPLLIGTFPKKVYTYGNCNEKHDYRIIRQWDIRSGHVQQLQREYHYIGYPLYLALLTAGISGTGVGVIDCFRGIPSLQLVVPRLQKALSIWSMAGYIIFTAISIYPMIFSDFKLDGF